MNNRELIIVLYTDQANCRLQIAGPAKCVMTSLQAIQPNYWAAYRPTVAGKPFSNSSDRAYLIAHRDDPFWLAQGVPTVHTGEE